MMVREVAVHLEEQLRDVAIQLFKQPMQGISAGSVARIEDHLHAALEIELRGDLFDIRRFNVVGGKHPLTVEEIAMFDHAIQFLDFGAMDRAAAANGLEAIVFRRIMAAGDHHAA